MMWESLGLGSWVSLFKISSILICPQVESHSCWSPLWFLLKKVHFLFQVFGARTRVLSRTGPRSALVLLWDLSLAFSKEKVLTSRGGVRGVWTGSTCIQTTWKHAQRLPARPEKSNATQKWFYTPLSEILTSLSREDVSGGLHAFE